MAARLREFNFSVYRTPRGHGDDSSIADGETLPADIWTEFRGAVLVPNDPAWWDGSTDEPDWAQGAKVRDGRTGRTVPGWEFEGKPPLFLLEVWREKRTLDGILIGSMEPEEN